MKELNDFAESGPASQASEASVLRGKGDPHDGDESQGDARGKLAELIGGMLAREWLRRRVLGPKSKENGDTEQDLLPS